MSKAYPSAVVDFLKYWSANFHQLTGEKREGFAECLGRSSEMVVNRALKNLDADLVAGTVNPRFATLLLVRRYLARAQNEINKELNPQHIDKECRYCDGDGIFRVPGTIWHDDRKVGWLPWGIHKEGCEYMSRQTYRCPCNAYEGAGMAHATKEDLERWRELVMPFVEVAGVRIVSRAEDCAEIIIMGRAGLKGHAYFNRVWGWLNADHKRAVRDFVAATKEAGNG